MTACRGRRVDRRALWAHTPDRLGGQSCHQAHLSFVVWGRGLFRGALSCLERQAQLAQSVRDALLRGAQLLRTKVNATSRHVALGQTVVQ